MTRPILLFAALLAPCPAVAHADVPIVVNSTKDQPDADSNDGVCDANLEKPGQQITLRAALMHANDVAGADTIEVPKGVYKLKLKTLLIDSDATGDLDAFGDVTILGAGAKKTIIDGKGAGEGVLGAFDCLLTLRDLTIRNGRAEADEPSRGGGIACASVDLLVERCVIKGCVADGEGGGISCIDGEAEITDTTIAKNEAGTDGGGCDFSGTGFLIKRCTFEKNDAAGDGGGVQATDDLGELQNCTLSGNTAARGGAVWLGGGGTWGLASCTLAKNEASQGSGIFEDLADGSSDQVDFTNTIVANDATTNYSGDGLSSNGGNIDTGVTCGFPVGDQSTTNPKLKKLKKNGGPTKTHALKKNSPAIDRGDDLSAPASDQRGKPRVDVPGVGTTTSDCGAFEFQP